MQMKNNHTEDSKLIDEAKAGNKEALNFLMTKYYPRVYSSLYAYTKSKEDSEDLAQATFVKAWKGLETFRGDSAFFTWLYRIAIYFLQIICYSMRIINVHLAI